MKNCKFLGQRLTTLIFGKNLDSTWVILPTYFVTDKMATKPSLIDNDFNTQN
jgi:hypothetical protein